LVDSQVDLNPHQADAVLFACRNPLSRGIILADTGGLGAAPGVEQASRLFSQIFLP